MQDKRNQALKEQEEQLPGLRKPTASAKALRWKRAQHQASYGKPDGVLNQFSPRSHSSLETERPAFFTPISATPTRTTL